MIPGKWNFNRIIAFIIPTLYFIWSIVLQHINGPYYLNRIDPTYPYLLNGLNCALFEFDRIGHFDHPGTIFQVLTGLFIWITYLLFGHGALLEDVISRPEFYLTMSSFYLSLITGFVLLWLGKIALKDKYSIVAVIIIQSTYLLFSVLLFFPFTYVPDRLLTITILILAGLILKLIIQDGFSRNKFAVYSGIIIGISIITKINVIPFIILPLFFLKNIRHFLVYIGSLGISVSISFLPIESKFVSFRNFVTGLVTHDGLYGQGNKQFINSDIFFENLADIFTSNIALIIIIAGVILALLFVFIHRTRLKKNKYEYNYLIAFLTVAGLILILIAKHYKAYYIAPFLCLGALTVYVLWRILREFVRIRIANCIVLSLILINFTAIIITKSASVKYTFTANRACQETSTFLRQEIADNYLFIEPTWLSDPIIENAMVFGISYVMHRQLFFNSYEKIYPRVITWEGTDLPVKYFRMIDADIETVLKSGKKIFIIATPGRNASLLCKFVEDQAANYDVQIRKDTIIIDLSHEKYLIRYRHTDNWKQKNDIYYDFEEMNLTRLAIQEGDMLFHKSPNRTSIRASRGHLSYTLDERNRKTPVIHLNNVAQGDLVEASLKVYHRNLANTKPGTLLLTGTEDETGVIIQYSADSLLTPVNEDWSLMKLKAHIDIQPADSTLKCFYSIEGKDIHYIDDLRLIHYSLK